MFLNITEPAEQRLQNILEKHDGQLALYYNEDFVGGFACGIGGVFALKLSPSQSSEFDNSIDSTLGEIGIQSEHKPKLEENLTLDFKQNQNILQLKGDSGILVDNMRVFDQDNKKLY